MKIEVTDEVHLKSVCDVLESMGYYPYQPSMIANFIYTQEDGLYCIGPDCSSSIDYIVTTLSDLLKMRDDMVKEKARFNSSAFSHKH